VLKSPEWTTMQQDLEDDVGTAATGMIGMHSLQKMGSTLNWLMGRSQDEVDVRGHWCNTKRISDRYTSGTLPIVDANIASALSVGGPAKYYIKEGMGVTDHWLTTKFVPKIADKFGI
jgi:hypothetical protein